MPEETQGSKWNKSLLIAAVIVAVVAVIIFNVYDQLRRSEERRSNVKALFAARRVEKGKVLKAEDVEVVEIRAADRDVERKMVKSDELALVVEGNRPLVRAVDKGEQLWWSHVTPESGDASFDLVSRGRRALTLRVDQNTSPGPLLKPGAYVDVLATVPLNAAQGQEALTVTLMERVLVLAVGGQTLYDAPGARPRNIATVTLEVVPDQAEKLSTINSYLRDGVTLVLRNSKDDEGGTKDRLDEAMRRLGLLRPARPS